MKYRIVSDSASNVLELEGVEFASVPLKIMTEQKEYVDTPDLDVWNMTEELRQNKGTSSTSCPNVYDWVQAFGDADIVFAVTITSGLSGSYAAAVQAREDYLQEHPKAKVYVVDSLSAGPEEQLLVEKLRRDVLQEKSFEQICREIEAYKKHTHLLASLQSLTNLARNGRVKPAVAKIAGVLGIRLIVQASDEGTLQPLNKARGEKKTLETLFAEMKNAGFRGGAVRIAHCFNLAFAQQLQQLIWSEFPASDVRVLPCTALCSYYAEQGGIMIGYADANA